MSCENTPFLSVMYRNTYRITTSCVSMIATMYLKLEVVIHVPQRVSLPPARNVLQRRPLNLPNCACAITSCQSKKGGLVSLSASGVKENWERELQTCRADHTETTTTRCTWVTYLLTYDRGISRTSSTSTAKFSMSTFTTVRAHLSLLSSLRIHGNKTIV